MRIIRERISRGPADTRRIGTDLGRDLQPGTLVALTGELGAGKTVFAQGLALGLGVSPEERVRSPTFAILHLYEARVPFAHADLYRLAEALDVESLGLLDLRSDHVLAVEWLDRARGLLGQPDVEVEILPSADSEDHRRVIISASG